MKKNKWFKKLTTSFLTIFATAGSFASAFAFIPNNVPAHASISNTSNEPHKDTGKYSKDENFYITPDNIFATFKLFNSLDEMGGIKDISTRDEFIRRLNEYINTIADLSKSSHKSVISDPKNASQIKQIISKYKTAFDNVFLFNAYLSKGFKTENVIGKDVSPFTDDKTISKLNRKLNGLLQSVEKNKIMRLTTPKYIYDIESTTGQEESKTRKPGKFTDNGSLKPEFTYKVFKINAKSIDDLPQGDKEAILEFHIPRKGTTPEKTFSLIISGEGGHISAGEKNYSIQQLIDLRYLFFREKTDIEEKFVDIKNNIIPAEIKDNIILTREDNGDINIYVKPGDKTIDVSMSEDTSVASKAAITMGILDHSYSPSHVIEENNDYGQKDNGKHTKIKSLTVNKNDREFIDDFKIFNSGTKWWYYNNVNFTDKSDSKIYSKVKVLKFYMDAKKSFNKTFKWNNQTGTDAFQSENSSKFSISTTGGTTVTPNRIQVIQGKLSGGISKPVIVKTEEVFLKSGTSEKRKFIKVMIIMDSDDKYLSFDLDIKTKKEKGMFSLLPADGMFYEDELSTDNSPWKDPTNANMQSIPVEEYKDTTKALEGVIGVVYSNWNGLVEKSNPDYMPPYKDGIDGKKEFPRFNINYHTYEERDTKTGGLALKHSANIKGKWTGRQIVINANKINNKYIEYLNTYLKLDPSKEWDENDRFTPIGAGSGGFFIKRIMNGIDPNISKKVMSEMEAGLRKYNGDQLTSDEKKYDGIDKVGILIQDEKGLESNDGDDSKKNHESKLSLYRYMEPRIAEIMEDSINAMFDNFKSKTGTVISESLSKFLKHEGSYNGINLDALKSSKYKVAGKDIKFITTNGNSIKKVNNGSELIKSLTMFISDFSLQNKYLISSDKELFNQLIKSGDFWNEASYSDIQNPQRITNMVSLLDKISQKISNETGGLTLNDIIQDKLSLIKHDDPNWTQKAIIKVLVNMVEKISSSNLKLKYKFLNREFESTYIQNLAIGYNLQQIYKRYYKENEDKLNAKQKRIVDKIIAGASFDTNLIVKVAINNRYYNIPFFINGLSSSKHIVEVANDLISADLAKSADLRLPDYNFLVKTISDPNKLSSIGVIVAGVFMSLIGSIILFISFKNKSSNRRVVIISRIAFIGIIVIGVGLIISPILFSSLFTGALALLSA